MSPDKPSAGPPPVPPPEPARGAGGAAGADPQQGAGDERAASVGPESDGEAGGARRKPFLLRLSPELMVELRAWSSQELRSLNGHIEFLLRDALRQRKRGRKKDTP